MSILDYKKLVIDFETKDPYINRKMGGGWVYKLLYPSVADSFIVGVGASLADHGLYDYCSAADARDSLFDYPHHLQFIAHNLMYDLGWYLTVFCNNKDEALYMLQMMYECDVILVDTIILAKLLDEHMLSYDLAGLAKKYKVSQKNTKLLADAVFDSGLYSAIRSTEDRKFTKRPSKDAPLLKIAYENLDKLDPKIVEEYCLDDIKATEQLYDVLMTKLLKEYTKTELSDILQLISTVQYACMEMRIHGIAVDNEKLRAAQFEIHKELEREQKELNELVGGMSVNVAASASLLEAYKAYGVKESDIPTTAHGNPSITQSWLEKRNDELSKKILSVRALQKIQTTYLDKLRDIQDHLQLSLESVGRVHCEFRPFGASTGRFSCNSPNMQQVPKRNDLLGPMMRKMFISEDKQKFVSADYSNQEQRIQVHYGTLLNANGADELCHSFNQKPDLDLHQKVADMVGIDRKHAKTINLGKSYGMGQAKLCHSLGLPTKFIVVKRGGKPVEIEVAGAEGKAIIDKYNEMLPFLNDLTNQCKDVMVNRGYIKSLAGRHLHKNVFYVGVEKVSKEHTAFNQLIQGSAADQLMLAIAKYYQEKCKNNLYGLNLVGVVHDEMLFTITPTETINETYIKQLMEHAVELEVPSLVEITVGGSWHDEEKINLSGIPVQPHGKVGNGD